jgi:Bacterial Ig-like domain (group 3)/Major tropism determinant N-terminal domain
MSLKIRRGTNSERLTITPVEGELIYTTDTKRLFVGDGATVGGNVVSLSLAVDPSTGNVTFNSGLVASTGMTVQGLLTLNQSSGAAILPLTNSVADIGSTAKRFNNIYSASINTSNILTPIITASGNVLAIAPAVSGVSNIVRILSTQNKAALRLRYVDTTTARISSNVNTGSIAFEKQDSTGSFITSEIYTHRNDFTINQRDLQGNQFESGSFRITSDGNFGIGTQHPQYTAHIAGKSYIADDVIVSGQVIVNWVDGRGDLPITVHKGFAVPVLTVSSNNVQYGDTVTLTLNLDTGISSPPTVTGTIYWVDGTIVMGSTAVSSNTASFTVNYLNVATHQLTARFVSDDPVNGYIPTTSSIITVTVAKKATVTTISATSSNVYSVNYVGFSASITGNNPSGTVTFKEGNTVIGTANVVNGYAILNTNSLLAGAHLISAYYSGDSNNGLSNSSTVPVTINGNALSTTTTTVLTVNNSSPNYKTPVLFTATVTPAGSGTVFFSNGGVIIGLSTVSGGIATLSYSDLSGGAHSMSAIYSGDSNYISSSSSTVSVAVGKLNSNVALAISDTSPNYGDNITLNATVTSVIGTPTGSVTFNHGADNLGSATLINGIAQLVINSLPVGTNAITAFYNGNTNYNTNTSSAINVIPSVATSLITIGTSDYRPLYGSTVTLSATMTPINATGTITFYNDSVSVGTATIVNGVASINVANFDIGTHSIAASYSGDANCLSATTGLPQSGAGILPATDKIYDIGTASKRFNDAYVNTVHASGFVMFGSYTHTQRVALSAANGMVIYNTTANRFQGYQGNGWINLDNGSDATNN